MKALQVSDAAVRLAAGCVTTASPRQVSHYFIAALCTVFAGLVYGGSLGLLSAYSVQPTSFPCEIPHLLFTPTKTSTFSSVLIVFRIKQLVGISQSHLSTLVHAQELGARCLQMLKHSTLGLSEY